jgi:hypothetical protein
MKWVGGFNDQVQKMEHDDSFDYLIHKLPYRDTPD